MNTKTKFSLLYFWSAIILVLIAWPTGECYECDIFTWYDKVAHVLLFGIFSYLLAQVLITKANAKLSHVIAYAFFSGIFYSAMGEFIQKYVPGRTVSEYDFLAGLLGIIFALFLFYNLRD